MRSAAMRGSWGLDACRAKGHRNAGCTNATCIFSDRLCARKMCKKLRLLGAQVAQIPCAASVLGECVHMQQVLTSMDWVTRSSGLSLREAGWQTTSAGMLNESTTRICSDLLGSDVKTHSSQRLRERAVPHLTHTSGHLLTMLARSRWSMLLQDWTVRVVPDGAGVAQGRV